MTVKKILSILLALIIASGVFVSAFVTACAAGETDLSGGDGDLAEKANLISLIINDLSQATGLSGGDGD
ncbi:MAG: hypothetical protein IK085_00665, partial [Clostridia bacterium]|nr:hypothetical protein [Clostridia bacterium]